MHERSCSFDGEVLSIVFFSLFGISAWGAPPQASFKPVDVPGTTAFSASVLDLKRAHHVEEEFYVTGTANRYRIKNPLETHSGLASTRFENGMRPATSCPGTFTVRSALR
jgi:Alpha/beta hydrolase domain